MSTLPKPPNVSFDQLRPEQTVQVNPVRSAHAAVDQPLADTVGRISGDSGASGPGA
jgi:hypothetical protein